LLFVVIGETLPECYGLRGIVARTRHVDNANVTGLRFLLAAEGQLDTDLAYPAVQSENAEPKIGDAPPALGLEKVLQVPDKKKVGWAALKGKVVVLEFWATW